MAQEASCHHAVRPKGILMGRGVASLVMVGHNDKFCLGVGDGGKPSEVQR